MEAKFKQKIALFFNATHGFSSLCEDWAEGHADYVRISEYVEIQFKPLNRDDVIAKQVDALDRQELAVKAEAEKKLTDIRRRKAELLALPAPEVQP